MAELSMTPVAPVTPALQAPTPNTSGSQVSGADDASQQNSFAHVLKERSNANSTDNKAPSKEPAKSDKTSAKTAPDKDSDKTAVSDDVARILVAMNLVAAAPAADAKPDAGDPAVTAALASIADKKSDQDKLTPAVDLTAQSDASADALALQANAAVIPVKIAPDAATIAGKSEQKGDLKTDLDLSSTKTSAKPDLPLNTKPELRDKTDLSEEPKVLAAVGGAGESATRIAADSAARVVADLAIAPDAADANRASHALNNVGNAAHQPDTAVVEHTVSTPVGTRGWVEEVGQKLTWTSNSDSGRASIVLTPPHMGRVEVSINVSGDQASASFIAASPAAREALQDAMPRLRELMAQAGINLGQADVSAGQSGQSQADGRSAQGSGDRSGSLVLPGAGGAVATGRSAWIQQGRGMIDTFA